MYIVVVLLVFGVGVLQLCIHAEGVAATGQSKSIGIVIHGGAGSISNNNLPPEKEKQYREKLEEAVMIGYRILEKGGRSLDAVEATVRYLEDCPLFNAGKGAVFTAEGTNELDSSIMDGKTLNAGAVASIKHIKNPISLARLVMEKSPHVMLIGKGAELFAKKMGIKWVPNKYFFTQERWDSYMKQKKEIEKKEKNKTTGTVGAVALDQFGDLAAATSTGGMSNKMYGRVGDSPIIGAGTYANNSTCAVSCTGYGEYFIRSVVAYDISVLMEYSGLSVSRAAEKTLEKVAALGGDGGVIAIDHDGNMAMPFNSNGMFRAYVGKDGIPHVKIYKDQIEENLK